MNRPYLSYLLTVFLTFLPFYPFTFLPLYAADLAEFQLLVPTPDPVSAGETLSIQAMVINSGAQTWAEGSYEYEAEIYDKDKRYLVKTGRIAGDKDIAKGESDLRFLTFGVPTSYLGTYYFRAGVYYKGQRIAYSDFQRFSVTPLVVVPPEIPKVKVGGNAILSYRQEPKNRYTGNLSVNLLGSIHQRAVVFNLYTNHTPEKSELYNVLFSYYSEILDVWAGDIMPTFSPLVLANIGVRGINPTIKYGITSTQLIAARSVEPKEGTTSISGTYGRYIYGLNERIKLPLETYFNVSYVTNNDDINSISVKGPSINPAVKNDVTGAGIKTTPLKAVTLSVDYSQSSYSTDTLKGTKNLDNAYRVALENSLGVVTLRGIYQYVGANYNSLGSPTTVKDRLSQDVFAGLRFSRLGNLSVTQTQYKDNIASPPDKSKAITTQNILSANIALLIPKLPQVSVGYSKNDIVGTPADPPGTKIVENNTSLLSAGIAYTLKKVTISVGNQKTVFTDTIKTTKENDRDTSTMSFGFTLNNVLGERLSLNLGNTATSVKRASDMSENTSNIISLTTNYKIVKDRLTAAVWGNHTTRSDKIQPIAKTQVTLGNVEFTYYFSQQLSWTLGGGMSKYTDDISPQNTTKNYSESRLHTRISLGF